MVVHVHVWVWFPIGVARQPHAAQFQAVAKGRQQDIGIARVAGQAVQKFLLVGVVLTL